MSVRCPYCQKADDAFTPVDGNPNPPGKGDVSLCLYCGELSMFTGQGLGKRKPTELERFELNADPDARTKIDKARAAIILMRGVR